MIASFHECFCKWLGKMPPGKIPPRKDVPQEIAPWKITPRPPENFPQENCPPWNLFVNFFWSLVFVFMRIFVQKKNLFSFNHFFYFKFVYFIYLYYFFLSVYFWFSGMAYNVYHTYMRNQQCWASLSRSGYTPLLKATLIFNSASVLLNILINWASNVA